jgi:hypothetical protein
MSILVLAGLAQAEGSPLSRLLATRPMAYLGRISYGTYLWHWPVIVALRSVMDSGPLSTALLAFGVATGLAALSAELVELPIRRAPSLDRLSWPVVLAGLGVSALVATTLVPNVLERDRRPVVAATSYDGTDLAGNAVLARALAAKVPSIDFASLARATGSNQYCSADDIDACHSVRGSGPTVLLVGDSQAQTFVPVFRDLAKDHDFNLDLNVLAGCPWQEGLSNDRQAADTATACAGARVGWYDEALPRLHPDVVVLLARPRDDPDEWGRIAVRRDCKKEPLGKAVLESTRSTLAKITKVAPVVVVQRLIMPETFEPADCLASAARVGQCVVTASSKPSSSDGYVTTLAAEDPRVHTLDLNPIFCPTAPVCSPIRQRTLVWRDDHHYTVRYAAAMRQKVWASLTRTGLLPRR